MISRTNIIRHCPSFDQRHGRAGLSESELRHNAGEHRNRGCSLEGKGRPNRQELLTNKHWREQHSNATDRKTAAGLDATQNYWKPNKVPARRLDEMYSTVGPELLNKLDQQSDNGTLRLYRTMSQDEAGKIMDWKDKRHDAENLVRDHSGYTATRYKNENYILPVSGHLGDYTQAKTYKDKSPANTMMEFKLKPGAHNVLFTPDHMALAPAGKGAGRSINELHGRSFPSGSKNEGLLGGYAGLKAENRGDFSIAIGDSDASRLNLQLMVDDVRRSPAPPSIYGTPYSSSPASTSGFPPHYSNSPTSGYGNVDIVDADPDAESSYY